MSEQFNFENLGVTLPNPHPFELSDEERMEKYQKIAESLEKLKAEALEDFSSKYDALLDFFDWLDLILPENKYSQEKNRIIESAKCFADCIAGFDPLEDDEYFKKWNEDQNLWHMEVESVIKEGLPKIINAIGHTPELELKNELERLIGEDHKFFNEFALFIACKQTIWPGDKREKVPVEKQ
jgi:hypothetical protein